MKSSLSPIAMATAMIMACSVSVRADPIIYTVTTSSGANATNLLSEATVEIDDNGAISDANFADVTFAANSIFRKRGEGFLKSCSGMGEFTGEVRIEEGAIIIDDVGQLGRTVNGATTDPLVVVSNGASLVVAFDGNPATDARRNLLRLCGGVRIAGAGYQKMGAVRSESTQRLRYLFSSAITLLDDATIVNASRASSSDDKEWGTLNSINCNLNTHTLTVKGLLLREYQMTFSNPGHVVVAEDSILQFYNHNKTWTGGETNTLTVKTGGVLDLTGGDSGSALRTPWTLVLEDGARIMSSASSSRGYIDKNLWAGPVLLEGRAIVDNGGNSKGVALLGPVSGSGGLNLGQGGIELASPSNSFAGGVCASVQGSTISSLGLWSGTALPSPLTATNSSLSLSVPEIYRLPQLSFHTDSGKSLSVAGGAGGTVASLSKTGPGTLELTAPLAVTGGVTLAGGTLRLSSEMSSYSPAPGLIESHHVAGSTAYSSLLNDWYTDGTVMNTNAIVRLAEVTTVCHQFDSKAEQYSFNRYKGYIWNRSNDDVQWTFALSMQMSCQLYIDSADTPVISYGDSSWASKIPSIKTLTLTPGAHYFDLRMANSSYKRAGPRNDGNNQSVVNWPTNYGFVIDFEGRGSYDGNNYAIPSNNVWSVLPGGDGSLFTVDARDSDDITGDNYTRASFPVLDAMPGTTLDLNAAGCTFTVQELSGITAVTNGSLHVVKKWTLSNEALAAGRPLTGDAKLSFATGWTLSIPELGTLGAPNKRVLAIAADGGLTLPAVFDRGMDPSYRWSLELSADGSVLSLVRNGFMMTIR